MKNFLKIAVAVFVLLTIFSNATAMGRRQSNEIAINAEAPDFCLNDMDGKKIKLSDFKKKKHVMMFFWATWCYYCRKEIKYFNDKYDDLEDDGIEVLAINLDESKKTIKRFMSSKPLKYRMLLDTGSRVASLYELLGVPTYVLVDKKGIIKFIGSRFPNNYQDIFSD